MCSICLDDKKECLTLQEILHKKYKNTCTCNIKIHNECFNEWILKNNTCPICKVKLIKQDSKLIYLLLPLMYVFTCIDGLIFHRCIINTIRTINIIETIFIVLSLTIMPICFVTVLWLTHI
jgi:hypothetical protein